MSKNNELLKEMQTYIEELGDLNQQQAKKIGYINHLIKEFKQIRDEPSKIDEGFLTGTVKWYNDAKGYGYITPDNGGEEFFVHFTTINMPGFKTLREGQKVSYVVQGAPNRYQAVAVKPLEK